MLYDNDNLEFRTGDNVQIHLPIAGIGPRLLAALFDNVIIICLYIGYFFVESVLMIEHDLLYIINSVILTLGYIGYYMFWEVLYYGQTPGKRFIKIRVIKANGATLGFSEVILRQVLRLIDFLPFLYSLGVVTMIFTEKKQRIGDLVANTVCIWDTYNPKNFRSYLGSLEFSEPEANSVFNTLAKEDQIAMRTMFAKVKSAPVAKQDYYAVSILNKLDKKYPNVLERTPNPWTDFKHLMKGQ